MAIYTRPQILVLLAMLATTGIGLGVGQWRRAFPEVAERLERIEREVGDEAPGASPAGIPGARDAGGDAPRRSSGRVAPGRGDEAARGRPSSRAEKLASGRSGDGAGTPLDLNAAVLDDLVRLPGVGAVLAGRILEARDAEHFSSIEDLRRVRGLGRAKIERLRPYLTVVAGRTDGPLPTGAAPPTAPSPDRAPTPDDLEPAPEDE